MQKDDQTQRVQPNRRQVLQAAGIGLVGIAVTPNEAVAAESNVPTPGVNSAADWESTTTDVTTTQTADGDVLILKNCDPWDIPANETALSELDVTYEVRSMDDAVETFWDNEELLYEYDAVVVPSTQPEAYYVAMTDLKPLLDEYVRAGGTLVAHMGTRGWPCSSEQPIPLDVESDYSILEEETTDQPTDIPELQELTAVEPDHPIVEEFNDADLSSWSETFSSFGVVRNLPSETTPIVALDVDPNNSPVSVEYSKGEGSVLATMMVIEWPYGADETNDEDAFGGTRELLKSELEYAIEGAVDDGEESDDEDGRTAEDESVLLDEDFESFAVGAYPDHWTINGNGDQEVTDEDAASGSQSLRLRGSSGGCWEAIANADTGFPTAGQVTIRGQVKPTTNGVEGCHSHRAKLSYGTSDESWSSGSQQTFLRFGTDGTLNNDLGEYAVDAWNTFEITYERNDGEVTIEYEINDAQRGTVTRDVADEEDDLRYLTLNSGEFTVYWDDLEVEHVHNGDEEDDSDDEESGDDDSGEESDGVAEYAGEDGTIDTQGVLDAFGDWRAGNIGTELLLAVFGAWQSGEQVT